MTYNIKTIYPKEEQLTSESTYITTSKQELISEKEAEEVIELYENHLRAGYNVGYKFNAPQNQDENVDTPFEIAHQLEQNGIDYMATLKLKNKGPYETAMIIVQMIEQYGYDFVLDIKLQINEDSTVNINHMDTWVSDDYGKYTVTPKAKSADINELKGLYDDLLEGDYDVSIDIKPKTDKDSDVSETETFATQLMLYPDETEITFTLKDSEY